jgi:hypothetical protein
MWDNWQRHEVIIKRMKKRQAILTDFDIKISSCFCNHRGLFFDLFTDTISIKIKVCSILDPQFSVWLVLHNESFKYAHLRDIVYHKIFDSYFIQIGKLLIDCTNLIDLTIHKGEKDLKCTQTCHFGSNITLSTNHAIFN